MKAQTHNTPGTTTGGENIVSLHSNTDSQSEVEIEGRPVDDQFRMLVAQQPFLAGMTPRQLDLMAESALIMNFQAGEWIFLEGDLANRFFLILEGEVVIESDTDDFGHIPIEILGRGDDLGWSWLFPPHNFHFNARALTQVRAICFYGTRLRRQCEEDHELGFELMKRVSQVTITRLQATRKQLLKCAAAAEAEVKN